MADQSDLQQYYRLADILIEQAGKEQLAQCARLLALNLAHYQGKFGEMPLEDTLAILARIFHHPHAESNLEHHTRHRTAPDG